jgi:4-amino-4-deoxy-L-arabinose transferase-like glycosyltransferase
MGVCVFIVAVTAINCEPMRRGTLLLHAVAVAVLTLAVLVVNARGQLYDSNLHHLAPGMAMLAGDHPYRDFFEWGVPAGAVLSMAAQWLVGYRLIGEFLIHWICITAGVVVAFHLGLQLSRSAAASLAALVAALLLLANTPTYHYTKLIVFPVALWCAWRYTEHPGARGAAALGVVGALGFLFRHDYGLYIAVVAIAAGLLVCAASPVRTWAGLAVRHSAAAIVAAVLVLAPWAAVVQMNEGLWPYTEARLLMYEAPPGFVYRALLRVNPWRDLRAEPPPPTPGVVAFVWNPGRVNGERQRELEQRYAMRRLPDLDEQGRLQYEIPNLFDTRLFELDPYINDGKGFEWNRLEEIRLGLPPPDNALAWLTDVMLALPLLFVATGALLLWRTHRQPGVDRTDAQRLLLAGTFLVAIDASLFRQASYAVVVAPLTLALGARFLARGPMATRLAAVVVLVLTGYAAVVFTREAPMYEPARLAGRMSEAFTRLLASPPVAANPSYRYLYDCTAPGDRLLITGSTPFDVNYFTERRFAGGHVLWHFAWRSDPVREAESLALLERQRVPFAFSTSDPLLADFKHYPRIREYLRRNFREVDGYGGRLLVNTTLQPVRHVEPGGLECFR